MRKRCSGVAAGNHDTAQIKPTLRVIRFHHSCRLGAVVILTAGDVVAAASLMEQWRQTVEPGLREATVAMARLRTEQALLPEAMDRPDYAHPGYRSLPAAVPATEKWVQVDLGNSVPVDDIVLIPAVLPDPKGAPATIGFPLRYRVDVSLDPDFKEASTVADYSTSDVIDPGPMPVVIGRAGREARYVRVTAHQLRGEPDNYFLALGELVVTSGNRNVAQGARVHALDVLVSPRWHAQALTDGVSVVGRPVERRLQPTNGYHGAVEASADVVQWVQVDLGRRQSIDGVHLVPARPIDFPDTIGFGFPLRFRVEVSDDAEMTDARVIADHTAADFPNPGDRRVVVPAAGASGRYLRVTACKLWLRRQPGEYVFALAEIEVMSGGRNVAADHPVSESSPLNESHPPWAPEFLVDGIAPREGVGTYAEWLSSLARRHVVDGELAELEARAAAMREEADRTLAWVGCALAGAVVVTGAGAGWWARVRQRRQMHRLRARIARDLHDDIGSNLGSISLMAELGIQAAPETAAMRSELEEIRQVAAQTADAMHDIVWLMHPGPRTAGDLAARLRETAGLMLGGLPWTMEVNGLNGRLMPSLDAQRDMFLIFKESLHNIRRHAGACRVSIALTGGADGLQLRISDDGVGFNSALERRGHGLVNMERRAADARGRLTIESSPGGGTRLILHIPTP